MVVNLLPVTAILTCDAAYFPIKPGCDHWLPKVVLCYILLYCIVLYCIMLYYGISYEM
jgi:hypothetical protein